MYIVALDIPGDSENHLFEFDCREDAQGFIEDAVNEGPDRLQWAITPPLD